MPEYDIGATVNILPLLREKTLKGALKALPGAIDVDVSAGPKGPGPRLKLPGDPIPDVDTKAGMKQIRQMDKRGKP